MASPLWGRFRRGRQGDSSPARKLCAKAPTLSLWRLFVLTTPQPLKAYLAKFREAEKKALAANAKDKAAAAAAAQGD